MSRRLIFLDAALRLEGQPYLWCGKGPTAFDCSGLATWCLRAAGGPDWRTTHNAQRLWDGLPGVPKPAPGDLVFYGRLDRVVHVMVWWGDGRVFGACGGDRGTTSLELAAARGARVRFRRSAEYRVDVLGYRSLAQYLDREAANA